MPVMYKRKLVEVEELSAPDNLIFKEGFTDVITVTGTGEYKRGTLMMSGSDGHFTQATASGLKTAGELCVLLEDIELGEDMLALTIGAFETVFSRRRMILPEGVHFDDETIAALRQKSIFVR